jgi:hypothetical protein
MQEPGQGNIPVNHRLKKTSTFVSVMVFGLSLSIGADIAVVQ